MCCVCMCVCVFACLLVLRCFRTLGTSLPDSHSHELFWFVGFFLLNLRSVLARWVHCLHQPFNNGWLFWYFYVIYWSNMLRCDKLHAKLLWPKLFQNWENWIFKFWLQLLAFTYELLADISNPISNHLNFEMRAGGREVACVRVRVCVCVFLKMHVLDFNSMRRFAL